MPVPGYPGALRVLSQNAGGDVHRALAVAGQPVPAWDPVVYLADFAHQVLFPHLRCPDRRDARNPPTTSPATHSTTRSTAAICISRSSTAWGMA